VKFQPGTSPSGRTCDLTVISVAGFPRVHLAGIPEHQYKATSRDKTDQPPSCMLTHPTDEDRQREGPTSQTVVRCFVGLIVRFVQDHVGKHVQRQENSYDALNGQDLQLQPVPLDGTRLWVVAD